MKRRHILSLALCLSAAPCAWGQLSSESLLSNSPFVPAGWTENSPLPGSSGQSSNQPYQFRGVYSLAGDYFVNIFNSAKGKGVWLGEGKESDGIRLVSYDAANNRVTLTINGQREVMGMTKPSNAASQLGNIATANANDTDQQVKRRVIRRTVNTRDFRRMPPPPPPPQAVLDRLRARQEGIANKNRAGGLGGGVSTTGNNATVQGGNQPAGRSGGSGVQTNEKIADTKSEFKPLPNPGSPPNFTPTLPPDLKKIKIPPPPTD